MISAAEATLSAGRERDLRSVLALLRSAETILVTVVGPPGIGKTRLAAEVAAALGSEFVDRVAYVDVGSTPAPDLVLPAIARGFDVTGEASRDTIAAAVAGRQFLLVLDDVNSGAATAVAEIVPLLGRGRLLATSEAPLGLDGECVHFLPLLDDRRFGGLPLVAELAAALPAALGATEPTSVSEVLDLAYGALEPWLQTCFAWLSVFAGGWTREAAEAVCGNGAAEALTTLEGRRLIGSRPETGRFAMHPAIRAYAVEQLERLGEAEAAKRSLAEWIIDRTEVGRREVRAGNAPPREWRAGLEAEANNLRAALVWADANAHDLLIRMVIGASWFYRSTSQSEAKLWLERALVVCPSGEPELRADLLEGAAVNAADRGDGRSADLLAGELLAVRRQFGDSERLTKALVVSGNTAASVHDYARAIPLYAEARELGQRIGDVWALCFSTFNLADTYLAQGEIEPAQPLFEEALQLFTEAGKPAMAAVTRAMLGYIAGTRGDLARAQGLFRETVTASQKGATRTELVLGLEGLAWLAFERGELDRAARLLGAAERIRHLAGIQVQDAERPFRERVVTAVEAGGPGLALARTQGQALQDAAAAAYAFGD